MYLLESVHDCVNCVHNYIVNIETTDHSEYLAHKSVLSYGFAFE